MIKRTLVAAMLVTTAVVPAAYAEQTKSVEFIQIQETNEHMASELIGQTVKGTSGKELGDVNNLVVDEKGDVTAAVIGVGGILGIGEKNIAVPFASLAQQKDEDGNPFIVVNLTKEQIEKAPEFKSNEPTMMEKIEKSANEAGEKAKEMAKDAKESVKDMSEKAKKKADELTKKNETVKDKERL